jgi:hypothetical protein
MDYPTPTEASKPEAINFNDVHTLILILGAAVLSLCILLVRMPSGAVVTAEEISLMPYWGPWPKLLSVSALKPKVRHACLALFAHANEGQQKTPVARSSSTRTPRILGALRRTVHCASTVALLEELVFNLRIDPMEPLLGALGSLLRSSEFVFQCHDPIFRSPELIRKLLRHAQRLATILVSYASGLRDQLQDGLACLVELIVRPGQRAVARSCEWSDVWILSELTMHRLILGAQRYKLPPKTAAAGDNPRPPQSFVRGCGVLATSTPVFCWLSFQKQNSQQEIIPGRIKEIQDGGRVE